MIDVVDDETSEVIKEGYVNLWRDGTLIKKAKIKNGSVSFEELCEVVYGVGIISVGYENIEFEVNLDCNEEKEIFKSSLKVIYLLTLNLLELLKKIKMSITLLYIRKTM